MAQVKEGQKAPNFKLSDKDGKVHQPVAAGSEYTVLYFYPKDSTPGCTIEAQEFTASLRAFSARKARVVGVSGGDGSSKAKFCAKYRLSVPLVSDTDFKVARAYGAFGEKQFMGRKFKGIFRKTFILDKRGLVVRVFDSVKPEGHADEVLAALDDLARAGSKKGAASPAGTSGKARASAAKPKKAAAKSPVRKKAAAKKKPAGKSKAARRR